MATPKTITIALACLLAGCTTTQSEYAEMAWQLGNAVDIVQTDQIARQPECFREGPSMIRWFTGEHPQRAEAAAIGIAAAAAHAKITTWFDDKADEYGGRWVPARATWHVLSIARKSWMISNNYDVGLWPGPGC